MDEELKTIMYIGFLAMICVSGLIWLGISQFTLTPQKPVPNGSDLIPATIINQTFPAQNLSITFQSSVQFFSIEAHVLETPQYVPLYKGTLSDDDLNRQLKFMSENLSKKKNNTPSKSEAPALAEKALVPYGGLPQDAVLTNIFNRERITVIKSGEITNREPIATYVDYTREIKGMPLVGEEDHISVVLGENGELLELRKRWRILEKTDEVVKIITPDKAVEKLKRGETYTILQSSKTAHIDDVRLGYYEMKGNTREIILEPVWIFKSTSEPGYKFPVYARQFAGFTEKLATGKDSSQVTFTDISEANPTRWLWDFGDGTTSAEKNPTHTYKTAGTYNVTLTVWNDLGSDTVVKQYTLEGTDETPAVVNETAIPVAITLTGTPLPTTAVTVNETATLAVTTSPTSITTSTAEGTQTITLQITTITITTSTTAGFNVTNES